MDSQDDLHAPARVGPVLTTKQAAEYVGLKPQTLRKLKITNEGPASFKHGRLNVYYPADLDAWLAARLIRDAPLDRAPAGGWKTKEQALRDLGLVVAEAVERMRKLTPREVAEEAWHPGHEMSIDELTEHAAINGLCRPEFSRRHERTDL